METVRGEELLDPTPLALPVDFVPPEPLNVLVARLLQHPTQSDLHAAGYETMEEADDFDIDDDFDPSTPYEEHFDHGENMGHVVSRGDEIKSGMVEPLDVEAIKQRARQEASLNKKPKAPMSPKAPKKPEETPLPSESDGDENGD